MVQNVHSADDFSNRLLYMVADPLDYLSTWVSSGISWAIIGYLIWIRRSIVVSSGRLIFVCILIIAMIVTEILTLIIFNAYNDGSFFAYIFDNPIEIVAIPLRRFDSFIYTIIFVLRGALLVLIATEQIAISRGHDDYISTTPLPEIDHNSFYQATRLLCGQIFVDGSSFYNIVFDHFKNRWRATPQSMD